MGKEGDLKKEALFYEGTQKIYRKILILHYSPKNFSLLLYDFVLF